MAEEMEARLARGERLMSPTRRTSSNFAAMLPFGTVLLDFGLGEEWSTQRVDVTLTSAPRHKSYRTQSSSHIVVTWAK